MEGGGKITNVILLLWKPPFKFSREREREREALGDRESLNS